MTGGVRGAGRTRLKLAKTGTNQLDPMTSALACLTVCINLGSVIFFYGFIRRSEFVSVCLCVCVVVFVLPRVVLLAAWWTFIRTTDLWLCADRPCKYSLNTHRCRCLFFIHQCMHVVVCLCDVHAYVCVDACVCMPVGILLACVHLSYTNIGVVFRFHVLLK